MPSELNVNVLEVVGGSQDVVNVGTVKKSQERIPLSEWIHPIEDSQTNFVETGESIRKRHPGTIFIEIK